MSAPDRMVIRDSQSSKFMGCKDTLFRIKRVFLPTEKIMTGDELYL